MPRCITEETTVVIRRQVRDIDDDLADVDAQGFNRGLDLAADLVRQDGDPALAALIRRQKKA